MKSLPIRESKDLTIVQKLARRGLRAFACVRYGRLTIADGETPSFEVEAGPMRTLVYLTHGMV